MARTSKNLSKKNFKILHKIWYMILQDYISARIWIRSSKISLRSCQDLGYTFLQGFAKFLTISWQASNFNKLSNKAHFFVLFWPFLLSLQICKIDIYIYIYICVCVCVCVCVDKKLKKHMIYLKAQIFLFFSEAVSMWNQSANKNKDNSAA